MNKKMIVVDLDGTLLNINGGISRNTKRYLKRLKDMGYIIVIATGRVLGDAVKITDGADFANYIISNSGGLIYDMDLKKIIMKKGISKEDARNIYSFYNDEIEYITICDLFSYNRYKLDGNMDLFFDKEIKDMNKFIDNSDEILHIIIKFKNNDLVDKYYNLFDYGDTRVLVMQDSFSNRKWIEVFGYGTSKYDAIKIISEREGISNSDVISFGDGRNDIDMIKNSGIGVAMGNALSDVKEVSDYITRTHNDDGVIYFLKEYLNE